MRARVDKEICTGCGLCAETCPGVFAMEGRQAVVKVDPVVPADGECCRAAARDCPVNAILIAESRFWDVLP